jgi:hypothetical protein
MLVHENSQVQGQDRVVDDARKTDEELDVRCPTIIRGRISDQMQMLDLFNTQESTMNPMGG